MAPTVRTIEFCYYYSRKKAVSVHASVRRTSRLIARNLRVKKRVSSSLRFNVLAVSAVLQRGGSLPRNNNADPRIAEFLTRFVFFFLPTSRRAKRKRKSCAEIVICAIAEGPCRRCREPSSTRTQPAREVQFVSEPDAAGPFWRFPRCWPSRASKLKQWPSVSGVFPRSSSGITPVFCPSRQ